MTTTSTSAPPCDTRTIDTTISRVKEALDAARAWRKSQARELALSVLARDRELPDNVDDLEAVFDALREFRIVAEYAELKAVVDSSRTGLAILSAQWVSCQAALEKVQSEYYAAASESRLPHHEHWDACAREFQRVGDEAFIALSAAREACSHEMTRAGDAKVRCNALLREHGHLFAENAE
jgi:hypothetical protein